MDAAYKIYTSNHSNVIHLVQPNSGAVSKKSRKSSEVYPYTVDELRKMLSYMDDHNMEIHILALTLSCNI